MALPILAPPPVDTIGIDPGVEYKYVVAQTGAQTFTVDPSADFDLSISDAGTLKITFTGGAPPGFTSLTQNIVVHATNPSGTVSQTIRFQVTATGSIRRYFAAINSEARTAAGLGAPVRYHITTDISLDITVGPFPTKGTRFAHGLPVGLTCDPDTGIITGTPTATNATYAIILGANIAFQGAPTSWRYWVLVVGAGNDLTVITDSGTGTASSFTVPTVATSFTFQGDFTTPKIIAGPIYERPFHADPNHYVYHVQYRVRLDLFTSLAWDAPGPYGGIHVGETQFKNERGGILTFWRTFVIVPFPRDEWESHIYAYKFFQAIDGKWSGVEVPNTVSSRVHYDYWHIPTGVSPATVMLLPHAPNAVLAFNFLYLSNGFGSLVVGEECLAENATYKLWMGNIYERKQRFIVTESIGDELSP
jgi:hypothetical protein